MIRVRTANSAVHTLRLTPVKGTMRYLYSILRWSLLGACATAALVFLYRAYILSARGYSVTMLPPGTLLIEVMELHRYAGIGAALGAVFRIVVAIPALLRRTRHPPNLPPDLGPGLEDDVEAKLHARNKERAERYLASRKKALKPPPGDRS